ncbi:glycosyltransferase family 2 protein [Patescibacteria group bacterium]|nr:glycosyltransferase family 2 protein [Patescibacteria group bacterium]
MPNKLFIVIVTWNGERLIRDCLNSVYGQNKSDFGVIVVDNNSIDGTKEIIRESFKDVILIENDENLGFAAGNNVGIKKALSLGTDYVCLLNQDTEVSNNFAENCVKYLVENKKVGLASPIILFTNSEKIWFAGSRIFCGREILAHATTKIGEHTDKKISLSEFSNNSHVDWIPACALFVKKDVFEKIGLLDEKFFMYGEDVDFSLRAKIAGYELGIIDSTTIIHKEDLNSKFEINIGLLKKAIYKMKARCTIIHRYYSFKEKWYYLIKLTYTPLFQLAYAVRKIFS